MEITLTEILNYIKANAVFFVFAAMVLENVLFIGLFIPGLSVLVISGFAIASGDANWSQIIPAAALGTLIGDNINFMFGYFGFKRLKWVQSYLARKHRVKSFIENQPYSIYIFYHFPVYLRSVFPLALATTNARISKWILIEIVAVPLFVLSFISVGYIFGLTASAITEAIDLARFMGMTFAALFLVWIVYYIRKNYAPKKRSAR